MKLITTLCALFAFTASAFSQYYIDSIQVPGGGSPASFGSHTGGLPGGSAGASFSGTELNAAFGGHASSQVPGDGLFNASVQGSVYWTVTYLGSTPPPEEAPVTLKITTSYILNSTLDVISCFANVVGDPVWGTAYDSGVANDNGGGTLTEVATDVGTWTETEPGVWVGNTGYFSVNVGGTASTAPPPSPGNSAGTYWNLNCKIVLIDGQSVIGG